MFVYLPELRRVRRISGRTASLVFGTDLSQDLERPVDGEGRVERKPDAARPGARFSRRCPRRAGRSTVRSFIDRETCTLLKAEFRGEGAGRQVVTVGPARSRGVWYTRSVRDLEDATRRGHRRR
jgi:hypothetical protein